MSPHAMDPFPHWSFASGDVQVRFVGRAPARDGEPESVLSALRGAPPRAGWLRQRHGARALTARSGLCGAGDGLWTTTPALALAIATADCVPVVCGSPGRLAAIHAGWRGLVAGVLEATLERLPDPLGPLEAWLGPAIGPCCYEVGHDVAARVVEASAEEVVRPGAGERPHLDLHRAAERQLRSLGVERIHRVAACTRCHADVLWSYRSGAAQRGRNWTLTWLEPEGAGT